jgi:8-oxo-dGTP pyrophosphatase MutT (NUDIX family)
MQECARGVLLTPEGQVLLMKVATASGHLWITPGGRIRPGEDAVTAAVREVREETGRQDLSVAAEIWVRHGTYVADGRSLPERERFFLMHSVLFDPTPATMEPAERSRHRGFRWWTVEEIAQSSESFAPRRLAVLLRTLREQGPPPSPLESGE